MMFWLNETRDWLQWMADETLAWANMWRTLAYEWGDHVASR